MKKTKKVAVTEVVEETVDIICNKCGKSCSNQKPHKFRSYEGLIEAEVHGGYDSKVIGDLISWRFSVCESCLAKFVKTFKIPVDVRDHELHDYLPAPQAEKKRKEANEKSKKSWVDAIINKYKKEKKSTTGLAKKLSKKTCIQLSRIYYNEEE